MTRRSIRWLAVLGVVLAPGAGARAEDFVWHAVAPTPSPAAAAPAGPSPAASLGTPVPAASLGRPEPLDGPAPEAMLPPATPPATPPSPPAPEDAGVARSGDSAVGARSPDRAPTADAAPYPFGIVDPQVVQTQGPPPDPPPPVSGPPPVPPATFTGPDYNNGVILDRPLNRPYWERMRDWMRWGDANSANGRGLFQSDHCFDFLASPVTNPFFFEDPRALTEVRPIFIYQTAPSGNPIFRGGHSEFFGTQARLAVTDRLSFVMNELGFVSLQPNNPVDGFSRDTGFAELHLGPKYTFLRNTQTRTLMAAGLTFEIPAGSGRVFQSTGNLGLDPYLSFAQNFRLPAGWGNLNFLATTGYSFGVDSQRSEFWHTSLHLDYNIAGLNKFYPLLEVNWYHYTKAGRLTDVGFEGVDLANFGSRSLGGRDYLTLAPGFRYKFREWLQAGVGLEWPLTNQKEITDFRFTFDLIFRY